MTKIINLKEAAVFNQIIAALNGVKPVDGSKVLSRTATTLEVEAADGTVYKIEGQDLTYFTDATATTGSKGVSDIGQPASGVITSVSISGALPEDSFQLGEVNFSAQTVTELWSDVVNSRGFSSRYSPDKLGDFGNYVMTQIDDVVGTDQNDYINLGVKTTLRRTNKLFEDGDDKVSGGKGDDTIIAGSGKDVIDGGDGNDSLYGDYASIRGGGSFLNNFQFSRGDDDIISGGAGNDTIFGGGGNDTIDGGKGNDTMHGGWGSDIFTLSDGNDVIDGYTDSSRGYGVDKASDLVKLNKTFEDFTSISYEMETVGTQIPVLTFTYQDAAGQSHTTTIQRVEQFEFSDKTLTLDQLIAQIDGGTNPNENLVKDIAAETQYLTGTTDNDIFVINGNASDYGWDSTDDGQGIVVWNKDNYDILEGFEAIRFNDQTVSLQPSIPVNRVADIVGEIQYLTGTTQNDAFVIEGKAADYGIDRTDDGKGFVVWNDDSFDILNDFERVEFQDGTVTLGDDFSV